MSDVTADSLSSPAPGQAVPAGQPAQIRLTGCQRAIIVLLLGTQFMLAINFSILNMAGFTLLFGRVGDIVGRHRMLLAGLALRAGTGS